MGIRRRRRYRRPKGRFCQGILRLTGMDRRKFLPNLGIYEIRGVFMGSRRIILESGMELRGSNFFLLRCSWFGEGSIAKSEDMGNQGLGSAARKSSWINSHSSRRGLDSADKEVYSVI